MLNRSQLIAALVAVSLTAWLVSGQMGEGAKTAPEPAPVQREKVVFPVQVEEMTAREVARLVVLNGRTAPGRMVTLKAEVEGRVVAINAQRGALVETGAAILTLDPRTLPEQLRQAKAEVRQRELENSAARKLAGQGLNSEVRLAESETNLARARAQLAQVEIHLAQTVLRAPFAGLLDERPPELGDYLAVGDVAGTLMENDPFLVVGDVTEIEVSRLSPGMGGRVTLLDGRELTGTIRYVASQANPVTRSFTVEVAVANPDKGFSSGQSARVMIPVETLLAHHLSPALLSLADDGTLGVKGVDGEGKVHFHPIAIIRSDAGGIWVAGPPQQFRLITVGQEFVRDGDPVKAVAKAAQTP